MPTLVLHLLLGLLTLACADPAPRATLAPEPTRHLRVPEAPLAFADTFIGCTRDLELEIANAAPESPLVVTTATSSDPAFRLGLRPGATLAPGETRRVRARFQPTLRGEVAGAFELRTAEGGSPTYAVAFSAAALEPPELPLDLVFVLDVSTTMDELAVLRASLGKLFDAIDAGSQDVRVGLTTFENDVNVHRRGAFLERDAFFEALDSQLVEGRWTPIPDTSPQLLNLELPENMLGALYQSATAFEFRDEARRFFLLMTDHTFLEPPAFFPDGTRARHSFVEVASVLEQRRIGLFSVHATEHGRGLSAPHGVSAPLVESSGGTWLSIRRASPSALDGLVLSLLTRPDCH